MSPYYGHLTSVGCSLPSVAGRANRCAVCAPAATGVKCPMCELADLIDSIGAQPLALQFDDGVTIKYAWVEKVDDSIYDDDSLMLGSLLENTETSLSQFSVAGVTKITSLATGKVEYERSRAST